MTLATLEANLSGSALLRENTETLVNLEANALTSNLAAPFVSLQDELLVSLADENKLLLDIARAEAKARRIDAQIDALVLAIKHACLAVTGGLTDIAPYTHFFKDQQPAQVIEPLLAEELDTVAVWLPSLDGSSHASLQDIGGKLHPLVAAGVPAMKEMSDANQALVDFYEVGGRFLLVQKINAARKFAYGKLGQLVHDHPELGLAVSFPDTFYLHEPRKKKETLASLDADIEALKKKQAILQIKRDKLAAILAAQETASSKKQGIKNAEAIAKAQKEQAAVNAKLAALQAAAGTSDDP